MTLTSTNIEYWSITLKTHKYWPISKWMNERMKHSLTIKSTVINISCFSSSFDSSAAYLEKTLSLRREILAGDFSNCCHRETTKISNISSLSLWPSYIQQGLSSISANILSSVLSFSHGQYLLPFVLKSSVIHVLNYRY